MRIPFEIPPKGMKDQNETGSEIFGFVIFMKQTEDNALNCLKKKTEKKSVFQKKVSEFRINGKDTVAVLDIDDLKRHGSGAVDGIFGATGRAESAVAAKGNKLESATTVTAIHCATKRRIATSDHAVNIFDDCRAGMESINHFFIMIFENVLKYVTHKIIMNETQRENNPTPQRLRGRGVEVSKTLFYVQKENCHGEKKIYFYQHHHIVHDPD